MDYYSPSQVINFDSPRGGISLVTEKGVLTTSRLLVQKAIQSDSGLYTCTPSTANAASVRVHILSGKWFELDDYVEWNGVLEHRFHLFVRRTSGRDAPRTVDEAQQPGFVDNPVLLPGHPHLSELSMALPPNNRHFNRSRDRWPYIATGTKDVKFVSRWVRIEAIWVRKIAMKMYIIYTEGPGRITSSDRKF